MDHQKKRRFNLRGFTTFVVTISFLIVVVSGIVLYLTPTGRMARWTGWTLLGMDKWQWAAVHINTSLLLLILSAVHLYFNWRVFLRYFRTKMEEGIRLKRELALACVIGALFVAGTLWYIPPFGSVIDARENIKHSLDHSSSGARSGHGAWQVAGMARFTSADETDLCKSAGEADVRLDELARKMGLPLEDLLAELRNNGIKVADGSESVEAVARRNDLVPAAIYEAAVWRYQRTRPDHDRAEGGKGYGRMTLAEFCAAQGLQTETAVAALVTLGVQATDRSSVRELSSALGTTPGKLLEIIRQAQ